MNKIKYNMYLIIASVLSVLSLATLFKAATQVAP